MNSKHGFCSKELLDLAQQQMTAEINSVVTVKNIQKFPDIDDNVLHYVNGSR